MVPHHLVQRLKYAERCGLWKPWQNLIKKPLIHNSDRKAKSASKPTKGRNIVEIRPGRNIVIIFILLLLGLGVSTFSLGGEMLLHTEPVLVMCCRKKCSKKYCWGNFKNFANLNELDLHNFPNCANL